jgi:hypothetical protein
MTMNEKLVDGVEAASDLLAARWIRDADEQVLLALAASANETGRVYRGEYEVIIRLTSFSWADVELSFQRL